MSERGPVILARVALAGAALTLVVIASSAYLRLAQYAGAPHDAVFDWMRVAHRLAASGVGMLALAALVYAWRAACCLRMAAAALVAVAFLLAVLGRAAGSSLAPPVAVANVLGGMSMLALYSYVMFARRMPPAAHRLGYAGLTLLVLDIALGVLTSAGPAGALEPAHRGVAALAALALFALAAVSWRAHAENRAAAAALAVLVTLEMAGGAALVAVDSTLAAAVLHNAMAGAVVVAAVRVAFYSNSPDPAPVSALCHTRTSNQPSGTNVQR